MLYYVRPYFLAINVSSLSHNFISIYLNTCLTVKHALNIIPSKNLTYFNKTSFILSHFKTSHLFQGTWCHAPCRISDRVPRLSNSFPQEYHQEIRRWGRPTTTLKALVQQFRRHDCIRAWPTRGPMPVPYDDTNNNAVEPPADAAAAPLLAPEADTTAACPKK